MCNCDKEIIKQRIKDIDDRLTEAKIEYLSRDSTIVLAFNVLVIYGYYVRLFLARFLYSKQKQNFLLHSIKDALLECKKERCRKIIQGSYIVFLKAQKKAYEAELEYNVFSQCDCKKIVKEV